MKSKKFLGLAEDKFWLLLTAQFLDANNIILKITNNDDERYCLGMYNVVLLLEPLYNSVISRETMLHFMKIFIYCLEFEFGDHYAEKNEKTIKNYVTPTEYFEKIKKNWNVDITAAIENINKKNK